MTTREKSKPSIMSKKPPNAKSEGKHRSGVYKKPHGRVENKQGKW
jgi:hypothetical protein